MSEPTPLVKRDVSWLSFNGRVLQEAADPTVPLYERLKFLAIYSANLDEFFRVRVASHRSFRELKKKTRKQLDVRPKHILKEIRAIVELQQAEFGRIFREEVIPELESVGIYLVNDRQYTPEQAAFVREWFDKEVAKEIEIVWLEEEKVAPFLQNKGLYFIVEFQASGTPLALVNIPTDKIDRFLLLPESEGKHCISFLDDAIRLNFDRLFPGQAVKEAYSVKVSRDAEMYIEDEYSGDLIEKIKRGLKGRNIGLPTRFLYDARMPAELLSRLKIILKLSKNDLIPGARYHNFNDFFGFPDPLGKESLHETPMPPLPHPLLEQSDSLMSLLTEKDFMLHFPYQKYDYVPQLIIEAAEDEEVESIEITLYRVAGKSEVARQLIYALEKGKSVFVFIEAKARFDEESNLYWGDQLKAAGAKVRYSYPGIKVHTKLLLIKRKESSKPRYFSYLGTGNFNEKTAKIYGDHALFTAESSMGRDVSQVFDLLKGDIIMPKTKHLFVSPFTSRSRFVKLIDKEIAHAQAGRPAYMILKMNSLEDQKMIEKLYKASQAGVKIQLIVRGICCLVPGVKDFSENIEVVSIVDRFLEHARVYIFGNGGEEKMYIASADWMGRNLDRRVEVVIPILDPAVYAELRQIVDIQLADNTKARIIDANQENLYARDFRKPQVRAQVAIYEFLKEQAAAFVEK